MNAIVRFVIVLVAALALFGCASVGDSQEQSEQSTQTKQAIVVGKTTKAEVRESMGLAGETVSDPESGDEVWIYSTKTPFFISFIPVIGDITDVIEMLQKEREWVVLFDKQGVVKKYELRELDY